jgi:tellurite resistance protein
MKEPDSQARLMNFPVSWFATTMGMSGFAIAWSRFAAWQNWTYTPGPVLIAVALVLFLLLATIYGMKALRHPHAVLAEFNHPVKLAFVPTFSISLLLLAIGSLQLAPAWAFWLWVTGTALHLAVTLYVLSSWIHHSRYEIAHLNPAWFIPVVGNILVPIAGVHLAAPGISWFFFSIGLFFWPVLTAILFYRLIFHGSLPERFMPTLFIFIAPPAVGFISWLALNGGVIDAFARVLYAIALFFSLLLFVQFGYFRRLKFFLSWWAYSFPLAAMAIASVRLAEQTASPELAILASALMAILTAVIAVLVVRTALAVARREVCVEGA